MQRVQCYGWRLGLGDPFFFFFPLNIVSPCTPLSRLHSTVVEALSLLLVGGTGVAAGLLEGGRCSHGHSRKCPGAHEQGFSRALTREGSQVSFKV